MSMNSTSAWPGGERPAATTRYRVRSAEICRSTLGSDARSLSEITSTVARAASLPLGPARPLDAADAPGWVIPQSRGKGLDERPPSAVRS